MVDDRETKLRYRADHILCVEVTYEKAGQPKTLGWLSALDGDEAADALTKKAKKILQKVVGGELESDRFNEGCAVRHAAPRTAHARHRARCGKSRYFDRAARCV